MLGDCRYFDDCVKNGIAIDCSGCRLIDQHMKIIVIEKLEAELKKSLRGQTIPLLMKNLEIKELENVQLKKQIADSVPFAVLCCNCVRLRYNSHEEKYCFDTADTPTKQKCPLTRPTT